MKRMCSRMAAAALAVCTATAGAAQSPETLTLQRLQYEAVRPKSILELQPFRHEIEANIEPFRGLLLGLFFMAIGMSLDLRVLLDYWYVILAAVPVAVLGIGRVGVPESPHRAADREPAELEEPFAAARACLHRALLQRLPRPLPRAHPRQARGEGEPPVPSADATPGVVEVGDPASRGRGVARPGTDRRARRSVDPQQGRARVGRAAVRSHRRRDVPRVRANLDT